MSLEKALEAHRSSIHGFPCTLSLALLLRFSTPITRSSPALRPVSKTTNGGVERSRSAYTQSFAAFDTWAKKLVTSNIASRYLHMNTMVQERGLNRFEVQASSRSSL
jgi:hypothetical protein